MKTVEQRLRAVYKDGALHPLEPLQLEDMQQVTLTVDDKLPSDPELSGYFTPEEWIDAARDTVTWEDVRRALAGVSGALSDAVTAQRQER